MSKNVLDIKKLSDADFTAKILELKKEQMNLRFQKAIGNLENPNRVREIKKLIAQIKTEQTARSNAAANKE